MDKAKPILLAQRQDQFGQFVPPLGDGRALLLGEIKNSGGEYWDVQL